ncbi:MAG: M18 family aminopeptidase [Actinomycetota bacterium]
MTDAERSFATELGAAIDAAPGPTHAVLTAVDRLVAAGFEELDETTAWSAPPPRWFVRRGGALVAGLAAADPRAGHRIVGAHTDSPTLRLKPRPDTGGAGARQLGVEVYGGALVNSWLDRDLGLSGVVGVVVGDDIEERPLLVDEPLLRIPQLAIHLDRAINEKGLKLDRQRHLVPVWGLGVAQEGDFRAFVADRLGCDPAAVAGWELSVHDVTPATLAGQGEELLVSGRLDNLCSVFCGLEALIGRAGDAEAPSHHAVLCCFDHEEVGSVSATGAGGNLLPGLLRRRSRADGLDADAHDASLAASLCLSADMAHATHPNYADRHDPDHDIALNGGPVIKTNANQRYATSPTGAAHVVSRCRELGLPFQEFVSRSDLPCGSTIGPVTAGQLGIPTVDVGIAQWAMHSSRETAGAGDPLRFTRLLRSFYA